MQKVSGFSCETWIPSVDSHYQAEPEKRYALSLFGIVKTFKKHMEDLKSQLNDGQRKSLAGKIKILSEEKLEYYKTSRFGKIKEFFSCLRNRWALGTFKSSGQLGLELSQQFLPQSPRQASQQSAVSNGKKGEPSTKSKVGGSNKGLTDRVLVGLGLSKRKEDEKKASRNEDSSRLTEKRGTVKRDSLKRKTIRASKESDRKTPVSPLYASLLNTFQTVWCHADDAQRANIRKIGEAIFSSVKVQSWKPNGRPNEYELELEREMSAPLYTKVGQVGSLILKKKITIAFSEIRNPKTNKYKQVVAFPPNKKWSEGIYTFVGRGWIGKSIPMAPISIEQNSDGITQCSITIIKEMMKPIGNALKHLNRLTWN